MGKSTQGWFNPPGLNHLKPHLKTQQSGLKWVLLTFLQGFSVKAKFFQKILKTFNQRYFAKLISNCEYLAMQNLYRQFYEKWIICFSRFGSLILNLHRGSEFSPV